MPDHPLSTDTGPFGMVPKWLIESSLSDRAVRVYACLAQKADNDTGASWPSRQTLSDAIGCSIDSLDRAVKELVEAGAITREVRSKGPQGRAPNLYVVRRVPPAGLAATVRPTETGTNGAGKPQPRGEVSRSPAALTRPTELDPSREREDKSAERKPRARDEHFDALVAVFGDATTRSAGGFYAKCARELRDAGATPEQIVERGKRMLGRGGAWAESTPAALAKHWDSLAVGKRYDPSGLNARLNEAE